MKLFIFSIKFIVLSLFFLSISCMSEQQNKSSNEAANNITWLTQSEGFKLAKKLNKPVILDIGILPGKGCKRCDTLDKKVWSNKEIIQLINLYLVPIRIDLDNMSKFETEIAAKYEANDCKLLLLNPNGEVIAVNNQRLETVEIITSEELIKWIKYLP